MTASIVPLADAAPGPRRVALGTFDGVHLGHRRVVEGADAVVTFDPHPMQVVAPERAPQVLTSLTRRAELLGDLGVRELVVVPFGDEVRRWSPAEFVQRVLVDALGAAHVSVGPDFRYGHRGVGDVVGLALDGRFRTRVVPVLEDDDARISSTRVRALLDVGDVEAAWGLLGAPFVLEGRLGPASSRGGLLLALPPYRATPAPGGYDCRVQVGDRPVTSARLVLGAVRRDGSLRSALCAFGGAVDRSTLRSGRSVRIAFLRRVASAVPSPAPAFAPGPVGGRGRSAAAVGGRP